MSYRSAEDIFSKSEFAATLAATLAYFLSQQGDAVGLTTFDEKIQEFLPARNRPGHQRRLMLLLENPADGRATAFGEPLQRVAEMHSRRGMFVLVSDLLAPIDELESRLGYLRARGNDLVVFHTLDPRELDFDFGSAAQFTDLESGARHFIDPACRPQAATSRSTWRPSRRHRDPLRPPGHRLHPPPNHRPPRRSPSTISSSQDSTPQATRRDATSEQANCQSSGLQLGCNQARCRMFHHKP